MYFETLQTISLNGDSNKPNDDRCGSTSRLAWIIDGATDMGPPGLLGSQGGAAWLSTAASSAFTTSLSSDIHGTCNRVFEAIEKQFEQQKTRDVAAAWEVPKAAFSAAQLNNDGLSVAWAADSPILLMSEGETQWCTGEPDTSSEASDALALGAGVGAVAGFSGAVLNNRRAHRAREDHVALSSNAKSSASVTSYAHHSVSIGDELLLMSDGFASLVTDYERYSTRELWGALRSKGLATLAQEIRDIEQEDAECLRFPRFKVSDDATAVWLRVAG
ncbi:MAG: hypothetical protein AAFR21_19125 [Pseudomonadota bacterium]